MSYYKNGQKKAKGKFENDKLFKLLNENILNKNITAYKAKDENLLEVQLLSNFDLSSCEFIGLRIKEDCFFDNERLVFEARIIGISPVVVNKQSKDTIELYSVYFPEIRKYLAKEKIQSKDLPAKINTLDDLFFYRYYHG